ncbi:DUF6492 family protein [Methylobacterium aquaticum]|uniref:DUF6492 family protein n=1 Tax=Methylobacterium aquaticum TaxID=270351 RepID=UPI001932065C|nr:DUF6492 family protein [Methylobacterium aquaticum]QRE78350.1 hypothetical protein F1D61_33575 [Methylobacterium aquaticum]
MNTKYASDKSHGIIIRTYSKDAERLNLCLFSIAKYCRGFKEIVVVCPESSAEAIRSVVSIYPNVSLMLCQNYQNDMIGQQITKLNSHKYLTSDFIYHVDSDCYFSKNYTPDCNFENGLLKLYHREYEFFYKSGIRMPWQSITSRFLGQQVDFEFMSLFPLVYPRDLYIDLEKWFSEFHNLSYEAIENMVDAPWAFSEFNLMGAFSYYKALIDKPYHLHLNWRDFEPDKYLIQTCQDGATDRAISETEMEEITSLLGFTKSDM